MVPKFDILTNEEVLKIHNNTLKILEEVGVEFAYEPALKVFSDFGQRIEGQRVFFNPDFVVEQVKKAPSSFKLHARNPEKTLNCNHVDMVLVPGYGAPYIYDVDGNRRYSTMEDYDNIVKLAGASSVINCTGGNVCEPMDIGESTRHLHMLYSHMRNSDKPFMGSAYGSVGAKDSIAMADILFGKKGFLEENVVLATLINSITPLKYDERMLSALMTYAEAGQCNVISSLVMSGSTGPAAMAGTICLQNAEVLAGIVLTQCVKPGAPVIYGSTSAIADMKSVSLSIGNPETALYTSASAQLGRFYGVPTRGGGGLCDSKIVDGQAGYESMMTLMAAGAAGINFVLHAAGILHYYSAFSYEKFIMDEEIAGMVMKYIRGFDFDEEMLSFDDISEVGPGGHFLYQESTLTLHTQELRRPLLSDRDTYDGWAKDKKDVKTLALEKWKKTLASYNVPALDESVQKELEEYMDRRSKELA